MIPGPILAQNRPEKTRHISTQGYAGYGVLVNRQG